MEGIQSYPSSALGTGLVLANQRQYIAFVSKDAHCIDVCFQGHYLGSTDASFTAPPTQAIFFRDDTATGREEQREGGWNRSDCLVPPERREKSLEFRPG